MCVPTIAAWLVYTALYCVTLANPTSESSDPTTSSTNRADFARFRPDLAETDCPDAKDLNQEIFYSSNKIPLGTAHRAQRTVPESWVILGPSRIPGAGLGVFARTFIPKYTWLGESEGEIVTVKETEQADVDYSYMWQMHKNGQLEFYVDAINERTSNWLRYINCPGHVTEENVMSLFCYGHVYYMTSRDITPGKELLIYYGDDYADTLGIDSQAYFNPQL